MMYHTHNNNVGGYKNGKTQKVFLVNEANECSLYSPYWPLKRRDLASEARSLL
jgi:hypothetical protein